jgi:hypothetical protein
VKTSDLTDINVLYIVIFNVLERRWNHNRYVICLVNFVAFRPRLNLCSPIVLIHKPAASSERAHVSTPLYIILFELLLFLCKFPRFFLNKYCGVFAQNKNCGVTTGAVARERPADSRGMVFSVRSMPRGYERERLETGVS